VFMISVRQYFPYLIIDHCLLVAMSGKAKKSSVFNHFKKSKGFLCEALLSGSTCGAKLKGRTFNLKRQNMLQ